MEIHCFSSRNLVGFEAGRLYCLLSWIFNESTNTCFTDCLPFKLLGITWCYGIYITKSKQFYWLFCFLFTSFFHDRLHGIKNIIIFIIHKPVQIIHHLLLNNQLNVGYIVQQLLKFEYLFFIRKSAFLYLRCV